MGHPHFCVNFTSFPPYKLRPTTYSWRHNMETYHQKYYRLHKERCRGYQKRYNEAHKAEIAEYQRAYQREYRRIYPHIHKENQKRYRKTAEYRRTHKEYRRQAALRKRGLPEYHAMLEAQKGRCKVCGGSQPAGRAMSAYPGGLTCVRCTIVVEQMRKLGPDAVANAIDTLWGDRT